MFSVRAAESLELDGFVDLESETHVLDLDHIIDVSYDNTGTINKDAATELLQRVELELDEITEHLEEDGLDQESIDLLLERLKGVMYAHAFYSSERILDKNTKNSIRRKILALLRDVKGSERYKGNARNLAAADKKSRKDSRVVWKEIRTFRRDIQRQSVFERVDLKNDLLKEARKFRPARGLTIKLLREHKKVTKLQDQILERARQEAERERELRARTIPAQELKPAQPAQEPSARSKARLKRFRGE